MMDGSSLSREEELLLSRRVSETKAEKLWNRNCKLMREVTVVEEIADSFRWISLFSSQEGGQKFLGLVKLGLSPTVWYLWTWNIVVEFSKELVTFVAETSVLRAKESMNCPKHGLAGAGLFWRKYYLRFLYHWLCSVGPCQRQRIIRNLWGDLALQSSQQNIGIAWNNVTGLTETLLFQPRMV